MHTRLTDRLDDLGRTDWVEDENEALRTWRPQRDPDQAYKRIKEARQLRGKALGVVCTVAAWRVFRTFLGGFRGLHHARRERSDRSRIRFTLQVTGPRSTTGGPTRGTSAARLRTMRTNGWSMAVCFSELEGTLCDACRATGDGFDACVKENALSGCTKP